MKKRPFLAFIAVMILLLSGVIGFIQSRQFARIVKGTVAKYLPSDLGLEGDFSEFAIRLFPPGISIRDPKLSLRKKNILALPQGCSVQAERLDLTFLPFQMFSGNIRVHEVTIVNGDVRLILNSTDAPKTARRLPRLSWDELFQVHAEGIALEGTHLHLEDSRGELALDLLAQSLKIAQWTGSKGEMGYDASVELNEIHGKLPKGWSFPDGIEQIKAQARINALGLQVQSLRIRAAGLDASASGLIKGNILNPSHLAYEASLTLQGTVTDAVKFLRTKAKLDAEGSFIFDGKVRGNIDRPLESSTADGTLKVHNGRFKDWKFDELETQALWTGTSTPGSAGDLAIAKAVILAGSKPREGGLQPGAGGRIEIGAFKIKLASALQPFTVPVKLDKAHIHWLGAPSLKDIYPLDFRVSGTSSFSFNPANAANRAWEILANVELGVDDFQLDNQRLGQTKRLSRVLKVRDRIHLDGQIKVDPEALTPTSLLLSLPHSRIRIGGKISFKDGYDLHAAGPLDLSDVREIAENPIRGQGNLIAHIHGPTSRTIVDFDADLKNAFYLNLNLGDLRGRITWDDDAEKLIFNQVHLQQGKTPYLGEGAIDLGKNESISLKFQIAKGEIKEFSAIFDELTKDLWWYPRSLNGTFRGDIRVSGGLALSELKVLAQINGSEWEYLGERFKNVSATGGYDRGTYFLGDMRGTKRSGQLIGKISYSADRKFDWELQTDDFSVTDLNHFAQLDVPVRGRLQVSSSGHGIEGAIDSETLITLTDFSVRGESMPPSQLSMKTAGGVLNVHGTALGGQGSLDLGYDFKPGGMSFLRSRLKHFDFSTLLLLLNPSLSQDRSLQGHVSAAIDMNFRSGAGDRGSGNLEVSEYVLAKSNTQFQLVRPVSVKVKDGSFTIDNLALRGKQGEASLNLRSRAATLEGSLSGELDLAIAEFLTSSVASATGTSRLDFAIGGTIREPVVFGKAYLNGGGLRVPAVESPFENITGSLQLRQNTITAQNLEADLAGGRVRLGGSILVFADRFPTLDLKGGLSGNKLKFFPFQFVRVHGGINVHGQEPPYLVDGSVVIDSAFSKEKVMNQKSGEGLKSAQYMPPFSTQGESGYPKFKLNIEARADNGVVVQNDLFDAELKGRLTVVNTLETPRIIGTAELIQGKMIFKNRAFQLQSATASFDNPTVIDPKFDLTALTDVNGTKIQLYAAGRVSDWKIELSSNPVLPESEILSLLALGLSPSESKRLNANDRSVVEQGEAMSLILHSLDFNREVQNKTGFQVQLGESVDATTASSIARPQNSAETAAAPKIVVRRQIGKALDLSFGSTVGLGTNSRKEMSAEYQLNPSFSVIGVWDNYETPDVQEKKSYGMDLKWQKRFK